MFVPADGCVLVDADYSQIELRLLAHIADDEAMQQAFLTGEDIHTVTAAQVFGVPSDQVTKPMRVAREGRQLRHRVRHFRLLARAGHRRAGVTRRRSISRRYFERFRGVRRYMDEVVAQAKERGYVETLMHRRRRDLPELNASNFNTRSFGERVALQHAHPGHGGGRHQARNGARRRAAAPRKLEGKAHFAGARRAHRRVPGGGEGDGRTAPAPRRWRTQCTSPCR